ncbi:hypothetical protein MKX01_033605 [Papaver californicum]|nr:hypothetical protein MKX01_033605 [Papaver californicum]
MAESGYKNPTDATPKTNRSDMANKRSISYHNFSFGWYFLLYPYFLFFMAVNIAACVYSAVCLILAIGNRFGSKGLDLGVIILDLIILSLLFAANGAASAVGVCNVFDSYCHHVAASINLSLVAALMFLLLLALAASKLHKKCP